VSPSDFPAQAPAVPISFRGAVSVLPEQHENAESRFNAAGVTYAADLNAFSEQLAGLVAESLERGGATIGPAEYSLEIQVVHLDFMFQGPCYVDYIVELGSGERFGQQASGESRLPGRACARALEAAVVQILEDRRTARHLGMM
jgi:hypothetical protein